MTGMLAEAALVVSGSFAAALLAKVTVTMALALIAVRLARKSRAAVRHLLLAAAFAVVLVLPIASIVVPSVRVEIRPLGSTLGAEASATRPIDSVPSAGSTELTASTMEPPGRSSAIRTSSLLVAVWAAGALLFLLPLIAGLWQMRRLRRYGLPWLKGRTLVDSLVSEARIRRSVDVLLHESVPGPVTCGIWRPALVLPPDVQSWTDDEIHRALVHEMEHVRRCDWLTQCMARIVCALYWFHPLLWIACRQMVLEAERACDDAVLRRADSTAYAHQLVALAERLSVSPHRSSLAMASRDDLPMRIRAVLDTAQARGRAGARVAATTAACAAAMLMAIAPLTAVAGAQLANPGVQGQSAAAARPRFDVASIRRCGQNTSGRGGGPGSFSPGRMTIDCQVVKGLIEVAYLMNADGVTARPERVIRTPIEGGPDWITSEAYTINATAEGEPTLAMMRGPMLQTLLEERFKLRIRRETREIPVYALTVANGGHKLKPFVEGSCVVREPDFSQPNPLAALAALPPLEPGQRRCMNRGMLKGSTRIVEADAITTGELTNFFIGPVDRPVIDRTGLSGKWVVHLEYAPTDRDRLLAANRGDQLEPTAPSIFTAVEEQLGLRLEPARGPGEYLVIDSVERPSEN